MKLEVGTKLGHYEILSQIGEGGMGEVSLAQDSRLDRNVAVKVLPAELSNDEDRLQRFEQEAKATSALNHPNILTVYDIGEHEGSPFIVAELLEGEELRARLDEGAIPVGKVTEYARRGLLPPASMRCSFPPTARSSTVTRNRQANFIWSRGWNRTCRRSRPLSEKGGR